MNTVDAVAYRTFAIVVPEKHLSEEVLFLLNNNAMVDTYPALLYTEILITRHPQHTAKDWVLVQELDEQAACAALEGQMTRAYIHGICAQYGHIYRLTLSEGERFLYVDAFDKNENRLFLETDAPMLQRSHPCYP